MTIRAWARIGQEKKTPKVTTTIKLMLLEEVEKVLQVKVMLSLKVKSRMMVLKLVLKRRKALLRSRVSLKLKKNLMTSNYCLQNIS
jgi:hypothetical protein